MAINDQTYPWADRHASGTINYRNIYATSFGYTETKKKVSAASNTAVLAATPSVAAPQTITTGITQPDVPRALSLTVGGTTSSVATGIATINGTNIEGKPMSESFPLTNGSGGTLNGVKAFKTVTSLVLAAQSGTAATFAIGTQNVLGVNHRLFRNNTTVKVYSAIAHKGALTLQGVPTVTANENQLELNTVKPLVNPDGTTFLIICYVFDNWALSPFQDQPEYSTTTSTSTSTTTSVTTTTSTSISSTSSSISSTSISTSSTSTSTTTTP